MQKNSDLAIFFSWKRLAYCLLQLKSLPDKTSETRAIFGIDSLKFRVNEKNHTVYHQDNINPNFCGCLHKGTKNVYSKTKKDMNGSLEGVGCPTYILHNASQIVFNVLSINIELIVMKYYSYFIYTVWTEQLYL